MTWYHTNKRKDISNHNKKECDGWSQEKIWKKERKEKEKNKDVKVAPVTNSYQAILFKKSLIIFSK